MNPTVTVLSFLLFVGAAHFTEAHPASQDFAFGVDANAASPREFNSYLGEKLLQLLAKLKTEVEAKIEVAAPEVKAALLKIREAVDDLIKKAGIAIGGGFLLTILEMLNLVNQLIGALHKLSERLSDGRLENFAKKWVFQIQRL